MADFNAEPYWDDFEATNGALERNYMRILFRPGYAVQARELTQIQSILQNQIKQLELEKAQKDSLINESLSFFNLIKSNFEAIGVKKR